MKDLRNEIERRERGRERERGERKVVKENG
jgi:hypothetical protein